MNKEVIMAQRDYKNGTITKELFLAILKDNDYELIQDNDLGIMTQLIGGGKDK